VSSKHVHGEMYSIQHYEMKVCLTGHNITEILLNQPTNPYYISTIYDHDHDTSYKMGDLHQNDIFQRVHAFLKKIYHIMVLNTSIWKKNRPIIVELIIYILCIVTLLSIQPWTPPFEKKNQPITVEFLIYILWIVTLLSRLSWTPPFEKRTDPSL
jgi:hypothetical protein